MDDDRGNRLSYCVKFFKKISKVEQFFHSTTFFSGKKEQQTGLRKRLSKFLITRNPEACQLLKKSGR
jgi:hypothetical protein